MIKTITLLTKFIVVTLLTLFFSSCKHSIVINGLGKSITGSGHVTTENRNITADFKSIEVSNAIELTITQSDKKEVSVEADDNLIKHITTKVENGVLIVACDYNSFVDIKSKKVMVKMPFVEGIQASSASSVKSTNVLKGTNVTINGASASDINVNIESENINCKTSAGSAVAIQGKALKFETNSSSGGSVNAEELLANDVIANASSGGSINVHPIVSLNADASSGGSINYNTNPKTIQKKSSSGGSINQD